MESNHLWSPVTAESGYRADDTKVVPLVPLGYSGINGEGDGTPTR
jgi:hypothetical protein